MFIIKVLRKLVIIYFNVACFVTDFAVFASFVLLSICMISSIIKLPFVSAFIRKYSICWALGVLGIIFGIIKLKILYKIMDIFSIENVEYRIKKGMANSKNNSTINSRDTYGSNYNSYDGYSTYSGNVSNGGVNSSRYYDSDNHSLGYSVDNRYYDNDGHCTGYDVDNRHYDENGGCTGYSVGNHEYDENGNDLGYWVDDTFYGNDGSTYHSD